MSLSIFLLWLVSIPLFAHSLPAPRGFLLNCGASKDETIGSLRYTTDEGYITVGNKKTLNAANLLPMLSTLRYFPDTSARKYCYNIAVIKGGKYLIRTTYFYGGFDGGSEPPVFDQIIGGTKWSLVNTTEDYANGLSSYYEIVVVAPGKTLSVCLARNEKTVSSPFISALEVEGLDDSVYNGTDFTKYALSTVARHNFGSDEDMISFPDDPFNRFWEPFMDQNPVVTTRSNVTSSDFWNLPPVKVFTTALTTSRGKALQIDWPLLSLHTTKYYIALYFQDNRSPSPFSWRVFSVTLNGKNFYTNLNVSSNGVSVYGIWPLGGKTQIMLTPALNMPVGPIISAGEILQLLPFGERTLTRDVSAMEHLATKLDNLPADWRGDPCLPEGHSWSGVTCSHGKLARVVSLNLTGMGLTGLLPSSIANLTALTNLWLGDNKLSGSIPEMGTLKELQILHLETNQFNGQIPQSLGQLTKLRELFLQNNKLTGQVPDSLKNRDGLNIQVLPGNNLSKAKEG